LEVGRLEVGEEKRDVFKDQSRVIKQLNKDRKIERFRSKRKSERRGGVYLTEAMTEGE
jgi:hypothetical protein